MLTSVIVLVAVVSGGVGDYEVNLPIRGLAQKLVFTVGSLIT